VKQPLLRRFAQAGLVCASLSLFALAWHCDLPWFERHAFLPQQFFIPADPRIAFAMRAAGAGLGALLLLLVPFLPRGDAARRLIWALLLAVPATEVLLQWRTRRLLRGDLIAAMDALTVKTKRFGVTLKPSMDRTQPMSGRDIRFVTDAEGRRISGVAPNPALPSLIFAGESTVAGHGLQWDETFPALLGSRLQLEVVNFASMNYRVDQSWLRLADGLPKLAHPAAVVGLFMPGLLGRSFDGRGHPLARPTPSGQIGLVAPAAPGLVEQSGFYRLWRHLYWSDAEIEEGMTSMAAVLREMASLAKARRVPCIFVVTGHTPRWMLHDLFEVPDLDYVVVEVPPQELLDDGHPSPQGSLRIANALEPRLRGSLKQ
jgi:hypothetical protein